MHNGLITSPSLYPMKYLSEYFVALILYETNLIL